MKKKAEKKPKHPMDKDEEKGKDEKEKMNQKFNTGGGSSKKVPRNKGRR